MSIRKVLAGRRLKANDDRKLVCAESERFVGFFYVSLAVLALKASDGAAIGFIFSFNVTFL